MRVSAMRLHSFDHENARLCASRAGVGVDGNRRSAGTNDCHSSPRGHPFGAAPIQDGHSMHVQPMVNDAAGYTGWEFICMRRHFWRGAAAAAAIIAFAATVMAADDKSATEKKPEKKPPSVCVGLDIDGLRHQGRVLLEAADHDQAGQDQEGALPPEAASADGEEGDLTVASRTRFRPLRVSRHAQRGEHRADVQRHHGHQRQHLGRRPGAAR